MLGIVQSEVDYQQAHASADSHGKIEVNCFTEERAAFDVLEVCHDLMMLVE